MNLPRRPEVWVLLGIVAAGLSWVAVTQRSRSPGPDDGGVNESSAGVHDLHITRVEIVADGSHQRLRVEFTARNATSASLQMQPPTVRLLDAAGTEIPGFFVPGAFPPALPTGILAASWLEFWLTNTQANGPLILDLAGCRIRIPPPTTPSTSG